MPNPFANANSGGGFGGRYVSRMFDPSRGGLLSIVGGAMGHPTLQQHEANVAMQTQQFVGGTRKAAIQEYLSRIQAGMPPQKALIEAAQTPAGQDLFMNDPDAVATITNFMKGTMEPRETLSPGQAVFEGNRMVANLPPSDVQSFERLSELAQLDDTSKAELAKLTMLHNANPGGGGDGTQKERAISQMVAAGRLSPELGQDLLAGIIQIMPIRNPNTQEFEGIASVNMATGEVNFLQPGQGGAQPGAGPAGAQPGAQPQQPLSPEAEKRVQQMTPSQVYQRLKDPADILDGAGPIAAAEELSGKLFGSLFPSLSAEDVAIRRQGLAAIRLQTQYLRDLIGSRGFSADVGMLDEIANGTNTFTNPVIVGNQLLQLHNLLDTRQSLEAERANSGTTAEERGQARQILHTIDAVRASLPPRENLVAKLEVLRNAPSPLPGLLESLGGAATQVEQGVGDALSGVKEFASEADAMKAVQSGAVRPGDRVRIGGQEFTWQPEQAPAQPLQHPISRPAPRPAAPQRTPIGASAREAQSPPPNRR